MEQKYIELLINKCTNLSKVGILFVSYSSEIQEFIDKLVSYVKKMGVKDIYLECIDKYEVHDKLIDMSYDEIDKSPYFNKKIWDEYAERGASFLMFETEIPGLNDDIDSKKLGYAFKVMRNSKPLYRKLQESCKLAWCIAAYPGREWAKSIYGNDTEGYEKLKRDIYKICMVDKDNPVLEWDKLMKRNMKVIEKLNSLRIKSLHYTNSLGTDLVLYLPDNYLYSSAKDSLCIVNMPSYEVFTSPLYNKTEGIVYSSKPLYYNGVLIDKFWLRFQEGKVVEYDALSGKEMLGEIINTDEYSCYLGEAALVEVDSSIARMGINFGTTLIDENASCHLALGAGFAECISSGLDMSEEELFKLGINPSHQHVDFMIGTDDLNIMATLADGSEVCIFEGGKYSFNILE